MLGIHEGRNTAVPLRLRNRVQRHGGLTGRLRPVDLHHTTARKTADAQRCVNGDIAGGNRLDRRAGIVAEAHDGTLAKVLLDLRHSKL